MINKQVFEPRISFWRLAWWDAASKYCKSCFPPPASTPRIASGSTLRMFDISLRAEPKQPCLSRCFPCCWCWRTPVPFTIPSTWWIGGGRAGPWCTCCHNQRANCQFSGWLFIYWNDLSHSLDHYHGKSLPSHLPSPFFEAPTTPQKKKAGWV